ncbi:hypothetical protein quinque_002302 [Culex quinquefasciatus]
MGKYGAILTQGIIDAVTVNFQTLPYSTSPKPAAARCLPIQPFYRRKNAKNLQGRHRCPVFCSTSLYRDEKTDNAQDADSKMLSKDATPAPPTNSIDRCHRRPRIGPNSASTFRTPVVHNPARMMRVQVKLISKDVTTSENVIMQHNAAAGVQVLVERCTAHEPKNDDLELNAHEPSEYIEDYMKTDTFIAIVNGF